MSDARTTIREFISGFIGGELDDDEDIFAAGHVNSLFVMQLVVLVEKEFGIVVEDTDLAIANFRSVTAISDLVASKQAIPAG